MLLRPRRPPPFAPPAPPSPASPEPEPRLAGVAPGTPPGRPSSPGALEEPESPVSPGSAQRTPWSARETELLLGTLLQPAVWRSLLLDRRRALPTYRRVSAALARQQVRRTPAQCRRRYKFLKDKLRDAQGGQPPGPFDAQIRELMGLLGDTGRRRPRRPPGRPQRGRRPAHGAPAPAPHEPGATLLPAAGDPAWTLRFSPSRPKSADAARAPGSPRAPSPAALSTFPPGAGLREDRALFRDPGSPPALDPVLEEPGSPPGRPEERAPPQAAPLSLNAALLQTLGHLGDIVAILGPLRDQLLTLNQHVEQLRGSFDQTVSLAVGFILGSAAAERGVLGDPRQ